MAQFRLLAATADRSVLLCTDLRAGNIQAAEREPWPDTDPKPPKSATPRMTHSSTH
jgi:hypothetical protein